MQERTQKKHTSTKRKINNDNDEATTEALCQKMKTNRDTKHTHKYSYSILCEGRVAKVDG